MITIQQEHCVETMESDIDSDRDEGEAVGERPGPLGTELVGELR